jgi:hypothetical protein
MMTRLPDDNRPKDKFVFKLLYETPGWFLSAQKILPRFPTFLIDCVLSPKEVLPAIETHSDFVKTLGSELMEYLNVM